SAIDGCDELDLFPFALIPHGLDGCGLAVANPRRTNVVLLPGSEAGLSLDADAGLRGVAPVFEVREPLMRFGRIDRRLQNPEPLLETRDLREVYFADRRIEPEPRE